MAVSSKAALLAAALLGNIIACDGFSAPAVLPAAARRAVLRSPASQVRCALERQEDIEVALSSRREALGLAAAALLTLASRPALAYDFRTVQVGSSKYSVPAQWEELKGTVDKTFKDPVSGKIVEDISVITTVTGDATYTSIKDLGTPEYIKMSKQLGLPAELDVADMVNAARRKGQEGRLYYDFDLAPVVKTCARIDEMVPGTCPYERVVLVSATANGKVVTVLKIEATAAQWKVNGPLLKSLRKSFVAGAGA